MDKYLKQLKPAMMKYLEDNFPQEVYSRWIRLEELYNKWLKEDDLGGSSNMMAYNMNLCYGICALYEVSDKKFNGDDFIKLAREVMGEKSKMMSKIDMNKVGNNKALLKVLYLYMNSYLKKVNKYRGNKWGNTWKLRVNPDNKETGIAYVLDSCPLYDFAKKNGYMEVLPNLCAFDHEVASYMHAKLIRHNILSAGDNCCEYWYVGDKSKEALSDTDSK